MKTIDGYEISECPFCGSENLRIHWHDYDIRVICKHCSAWGPVGGNVPQAVEAWNNQPPRALAEHQRIVIEHLFNVIEAAGLMLDEAYRQAQSQSTQTGSSEK